MTWKSTALGERNEYKISGYNCLCKTVKLNIQTIKEFFKLGKEPKSLHVTKNTQISNAQC